MGEFYNIIPWNSPYNDNNSVTVGLANGILQMQNNQLNWWNNCLSQALVGGNVASFMNVPGIPSVLNPLDYLSSVNLTHLLSGGCNNLPGFPAFGSGMNGFDFSGYWNNVGGVSGGGTSNGGATDGSSLKGKQINRLKGLLEKIQKEDSSPLDIDFSEYKKAKTDDEKLDALKDIYNKINSSPSGHEKLQEYLRKNDKVKFYSVDKTEKDMTFDDALKTLGYPESSSALRDFADRIYSEGISALSSANDKGSILQVISAWNQAHKDEHLLIFAAKKVSEAKDNDEKQGLAAPIRTLVSTLIARAKDCKDPEVTKQADELNKLLSEYVPTEEKKGDSSALAKFKKENLEKISKEFDKLYAMTKLSEAKKLNKAAKELYGFTDDFSDTDENLIDDKFIVSDIEKQLEEEKIDSKIIASAQEITGGNSSTTINSVSDLKSNNKIKPVPGISSHKVYSNFQNTDNLGKYYVEQDGKLYELKDVVGVDGANFKLKDGTKVDVETAISSAVSSTEVDLSKVRDFSDELSNLNKYEHTDKKLKCIDSKNHIYRTTSKNKNGQYNYFIFKDNKLQMIETPKFYTKTNAAGKKVTILNANDAIKGKGLVSFNADKDIYMKESDETDENDTGDIDNTGNIITSDTETSIKKHGRSYRKAMYNSKNEKAKEYMNSWLKLDNADEILDFLKGYDDERHWSNFINEKFTAKYVDDICNGGEESAKHVQNVAKQIKKVVDEKGWANDLDNDYAILEDLAKGDYERKWYDGICWGDFFSPSPSVVKLAFSPNLAKARKLDNIIDQVMDLYKKANTNES